MFFLLTLLTHFLFVKKNLPFFESSYISIEFKPFLLPSPSNFSHVPPNTYAFSLIIILCICLFVSVFSSLSLPHTESYIHKFTNTPDWVHLLLFICTCAWNSPLGIGYLISYPCWRLILSLSSHWLPSTSSCRAWETSLTHVGISVSIVIFLVLFRQLCFYFMSTETISQQMPWSPSSYNLSVCSRISPYPSVYGLCYKCYHLGLGTKWSLILYMLIVVSFCSGKRKLLLCEFKCILKKLLLCGMKYQAWNPFYWEGLASNLAVFRM